MAVEDRVGINIADLVREVKARDAAIAEAAARFGVSGLHDMSPVAGDPRLEAIVERQPLSANGVIACRLSRERLDRYLEIPCFH